MFVIRSNRHRRTLLCTMVVTTSLALAGAAYGQVASPDTGNPPTTGAATRTGTGATAAGTDATTTAPLGDMGASHAITPNRAELPDSAFSKLDTSGKGYLTIDDTRSLAGFDFAAHDLDHDGRLTPDEFAQAWQSYTGNPSSSTKSGMSGGMNGSSGNVNGAMAPRGGGVNGSTQTTGSTRTYVDRPIDSTPPSTTPSTSK